MVKAFNKYKDQIFLFLSYLLVFLFSIFPYADKDWGWHFKLGEYLIKNGHFMSDNPFTWTLPYYQWTNHEWLYDPLLYLLSKTVEFVGLSILGGLISFLTFFFLTKLFKLNYWKVAILGFFYLKIVEVGILEGLRAQVIANLLVAILIVILSKSFKNIKFLIILPFLFLFWVNFHGTFTLGLIISFLFLGSDILVRLINKDKNVLNTLLIYASVGIFSGLATLINPFGAKVYFEALKHASDPYLANVLEWIPSFKGCVYCHNYTFIGYVFLITFIFLKERKKEYIPYVILGLAFLLPSINARRYLQNFIVVTLPILAIYLQNIKLELGRFKSTVYIFLVIVIVGIVYNLINRYTTFNIYNYKEDDYCRYATGCSPKMADYLINHKLEGEGFNFYDWGGYYIGKGIPERLFIDGRMHLWKLDHYMPFADYIAMYYEGNYNMFLEYNFDWVLVPLNSDIGQQIYNTNNLGVWKIEFQDGNSILYTKNE